MSTSIQTKTAEKKHSLAKSAPQVKLAPKPQPTGLSREEIRQIVLEMIG
ncbi:hypothetical protein LJD17_02000 [Microvirga rosea]|nr:hypothetical protein [Microvirga rosea]